MACATGSQCAVQAFRKRPDEQADSPTVLHRHTGTSSLASSSSRERASRRCWCWRCRALCRCCAAGACCSDVRWQSGLLVTCRAKAFCFSPLCGSLLVLFTLAIARVCRLHKHAWHSCVLCCTNYLIEHTQCNPTKVYPLSCADFTFVVVLSEKVCKAPPAQQRCVFGP